MASVTILDQTYALPAIATERFQTLQKQVQAQQQVIQTGLRPQPHLWGMLPRPPRTLTPEERWRELDLLVSNYDAIIAELSVSKEAYVAFFGQLAAGVQQALVRQSETMQRLEEERLTEVREAETEQDEEEQRQLQEHGENLMQGVRVLGQATLLLLSKIKLCQESLARLVEDQDVQRRVLTALTGRLERHRRTYLLGERIKQAVQEAARMAEVALHFEEYMRDHLGPLQGILEQVVRVDSDLHRAVAEIEDLTRQLVRQQRLTSLPGSELFDERWLTFLTAGQLKKERLEEMWEHLKQQDVGVVSLEVDIATSASSTASPVLTALDNIRTLVEVRLAPLVPTPVTEAPEMVPEPPLASAQATAAPELAEGASRPRVISVSPTEPQLVDRFGIKFVLIRAGTFQMGSKHGRDNEKPVHTVRLDRPFYLGMYPVTQRQWAAVMGRNPNHFQGLEHPVEQASWDEVQNFIRSLNTHEGRALYRLPTEAEWEYAARAGATGDYCFGDDVTRLFQYAWYADNAGGSTQPVGQLQPNVWGLYDMHGNVNEWVQDGFNSQEYARKVPWGTAVVNPAGPAGHTSARVIRGGSCGNTADDCRSAVRFYWEQYKGRAGIGFRLLRELQ